MARTAIGLRFTLLWSLAAASIAMVGLAQSSAATGASSKPPIASTPGERQLEAPLELWPLRSLSGYEAFPTELWRWSPEGRRTPLHVHSIDPQTMVAWWGLARAGFGHDERIEFTGLESTFGVEGQLAGQWVHAADWLAAELTGELYLTQPFGRNVLVDYPLRESFAANFQRDPVELSQLVFSFAHGDWALDAGRMVTPFGRYYAPLVTNARDTVPFIRSEAIQFREIGLQLRYQPAAWRLAAAITNGEPDRDTNSSKAIVARAGVDTGWLVSGISVKWQDGMGSEGQKEFNRHAGLDLAVGRGRWLLAGEVIYDQYGIRRPGFDLDDIRWGRSLYNRQLNRGLNQPLTGWGYYINLLWLGERWTWLAGYGEYYPRPIGDTIHDHTNRRGLVQGIWRATHRLEVFQSLVLENTLQDGLAGRPRDGFYSATGLQWRF